MRVVSLKCFALLASLVIAYASSSSVKANNSCAVDAAANDYSCNAAVSDASCAAVSDAGCYSGYGNNLFGNGLFGNRSNRSKSLWQVGGWVETGLYVNEFGQTNSYFPAGGGFNPLSGNSELLSNVRQSDIQVNQAWVYFGKELSPCRSFDIGGRVDLMYGTDGRFLQSDGFERMAGDDPWGEGDYFAAIPQAYLEVGNKKLSVKAGKFLSLLGYESAMAPNRFFYSLSYSYNIVPATMTGAVATWNASDKLSLFGGWISDRNSSFDSTDDSAFVGGFNYKLSKHFSGGYGLITGQNRTGFSPLIFEDDVFVHSLVLNYTNCRWSNTFAWNLQNQTENGSNGHFGAYTLSDELVYRLNCRWSVGARAEWLKLHDFGFSDEAYEFSVGANWTPTQWLLVRPEVRYDETLNNPMFNGTKSGFADRKNDQLSAGVSCVVKF